MPQSSESRKVELLPEFLLLVLLPWVLPLGGTNAQQLQRQKTVPREAATDVKGGGLNAPLILLLAFRPGGYVLDLQNV